MRKLKIIFHPIFVLVLAQIAWLSLLGLWIYWFISNNIVFEMLENRLPIKIFSQSANIITFVVGLVLLVAILFGIYFIFINHNKQKNLNKLYDNFISNVTHELKSPLAAIQLYLETMKKRDVPRDKQIEFLDLMMRDASRLKGLINSILDISRLEQKKIAYDFRVYSIQPVIESYIEDAFDQFKIPGNSIILNGDVNRQCVLDRDALRIVFNNLIDNAIKYSTDQVQINIRMYSSPKKVYIEFCDTGIGMSKKAQKKVFRKFQRIYHKEIPNVKGTGLGLYWVKEIVRYHGGKVSVSSDGLNKGSKFKIELPIYRTSKKRYINHLLKIATKREKEDV
ncbi:GHKL domain-containing protein [candidate division KSB1 bacterium]|nr:GHKL domain-containing protein [candidate division KSB1 bacterium]